MDFVKHHTFFRRQIKILGGTNPATRPYPSPLAPPPAPTAPEGSQKGRRTTPAMVVWWRPNLGLVEALGLLPPYGLGDFLWHRQAWRILARERWGGASGMVVVAARWPAVAAETVGFGSVGPFFVVLVYVMHKV